MSEHEHGKQMAAMKDKYRFFTEDQQMDEELAWKTSVWEVINGSRDEMPKDYQVPQGFERSEDV